ncbi:unnamed protein product [Mycena citricolor]|uniref:Peptidase C14 caspase domain-containing protein n=1 Tax=Mycena citricolor TaxID=2018698 RepID=A0AAD2K8Q2_9AGAR|nr:unnamed protein product [Mycena citricolor]
MKILRYTVSYSRRTPAPPPTLHPHPLPSHNPTPTPTPTPTPQPPSASPHPHAPPSTPARTPTDAPAPPPPEPQPKKKALLIGIAYASGAVAGYAQLRGPHADVRAMRALLVRTYGYAERDVAVMLDGAPEDGGAREDGDGRHALPPTRANILRAIDDLVRGARRGDRFFFHYCGHTTQVENRSNSEEDGMDECLVPVDGEENLILDNELRRHLVAALPVGASLVAVFDSCHSASLLDLEHFRCNRVYVPWMNKGRRRSDERWNAIVRKHALPFLPGNSPDKATREQSDGEKSLTGRARQLLRRASSHISVPVTTDGHRPTESRSPTSPPKTASSPMATPVVGTPLVTTRRIYEAARTGPGSKQVRAWRTAVDVLDVAVEEDDGTQKDAEADEGLRWTTGARAGTDADDGRKTRRRPKGRLSLPLLPIRPGTSPDPPRGKAKKRSSGSENTAPADSQSSGQRRATVSRSQAVSVAVREKRREANDHPGPSTVRPALRVDVPTRPVSWLAEEGRTASPNRACESPSPVWVCQGDCRSTHRRTDDDAETASVISLASCKDYQLSWEDADGGSMTRELVRILEKDPHPTLRALVTGVSHALHRMTLDRHIEAKAYKRALKKYQAWMKKREESKDKSVPVPRSAATTVASPMTATASTSRTTILDTPDPAAPPLPSFVSKSDGMAHHLDIDNFQNPQMSSHRPLDMEAPWMI